MTEATRRLLMAIGCVIVWVGAVRRLSSVPRVADATRIEVDTVAAAVDLVVNAPVRNPFRVDGRFVQESAVPNLRDRPMAERPQLRLLAIVGGPPWQALLAGVPGRSGGIVVDEGRRVGDLHVRRVRADSVWVAGFDTLWTLSLPVRP